MRKLIASAGLAMAVTLGTLAGQAPANAQGIELRVGPDGVQLREGGRLERRPERRMDRGCSTDRARAIARDEGLRRARVSQANDRRIVVEGFGRRGPERIVFANRRGCPIIG